MRLRRHARALWIVFLLALAVRLIYFVTLTKHPEFRTPMLDARWFHEQALAILHGAWTGPDAVFRAPLYPWFLAAVYAVARPDPAAARLVQLLLGSLAVPLVAALTARLYGRSEAIVAAALAALSWLSIYFEGELLIASILPLASVLLLLALQRARSAPAARTALAAGGAAGLFALARPNILLFLPVAAVWLARTGRRPAILFLAAAALLIGGATLRNRVVSGEWVLLSSQGGLNFYIGNHREADGRHAVFPGLPSWRNDDVRRLTAARLGHLPSPNEVSRYWFGEALDQIAADPVAWLGAIGRKVFFLLSAHEVGNNRDLLLFRRANRILSLPLVSYGILLPLALAGLLLRPGREGGRSLLAAFLVSYGLSSVLFFVCARFRLPLLTALYPPAAAALVHLARAVSRRRGRTVLAPLAIVAVATGAIAIDPFDMRAVAAGQDAFQRGNLHARRGEAAEAIAAYEEAITRIPRFPGVHYHLGVVLLGEGREAEGVRELERAIELDPSNPRILSALAAHDAGEGGRAAAEILYRKSIAADPYFPDAPIGLGGLLAESGRFDEAETLLRRGLALAPDDPSALVDLGKLLAATGREKEGAALLGRLVENAPERSEAWFERGNALYRLGRVAEAAEAFRRAAHLAPRDVRSRMNLSLALARLGDRAGAARALRELLALDPSNSAAAKRLDDLARPPPRGSRP